MPTNWYYFEDGHACGPCGPAELKRLVACNVITPTTLVKCDGLPKWVAAAKVSGLFSPARPGRKTPRKGDRTQEGQQPTPLAQPAVEPAQNPPTDSGWHYSVSSQAHGPVPLAHLRKLVAAGVLAPTDLVLPPGQAAWLAVKDAHALTVIDRPVAAGPVRDQGLVLELYDLLKDKPTFVNWYLATQTAPDGSWVQKLPPAHVRTMHTVLAVGTLILVWTIVGAVLAPFGMYMIWQNDRDRRAYQAWRTRVDLLVDRLGVADAIPLMKRVKVGEFQQFASYFLDLARAGNNLIR
jgi:hypothetical protein